MIVTVGAADLHRLEGLPASFRLAGMLLVRLKKGRLDFTFPDGRTFRFEGAEPGPRGQVIVHDPAFTRGVLRHGDIGFAEAYMAGAFDTPSLADVLEYFTVNFEDAGKLAVGGFLSTLLNKVWRAFRPNTRKGSKRNILAHYDLGNEFYAQWLDPTMTYSSAVFAEGGEDLRDAQLEKYRAVARSLDLKPGQHVLEIGAGWGGFAEVAAREYGARVTSVTISDAQHAYAVKRIADAGLADRVDIQLKDYRDIEGTFDAVASIEMFEAVGEKFWPGFFDKVACVLKPGARASLQIITIHDELFEDYRRRADFIQRYIFPGGLLPSVRRLREETARAGLVLAVDGMFGRSYARTCHLWARRFEEAWPDIMRLGFDERFRRLWLYYLAYCEAGFRTDRIDVGRFVLSRRQAGQT
jgi:cyclopropane-fatty-acyl-phospholipid synthase